MESTATSRGGSLSMQPPQQSRKEWRAVSEHSVRNTGDEDLERSKLGQSDERTIYEQGREPLDVDFPSLSIDANLDYDILQQRMHDVARQRAELQQLETELRAQIIARSEIMQMQNNFDAQIKEHTNATVNLQDKLREMEQTIRGLERKIEDKDRELHAVKLDNQAAWAKEDLLREQGKELATYRRERDHSEAERSQHIKQIHELQEHFQDKERQLAELQEQHRVAQETIIYKDDQLREAQGWIARVQEMDIMQSTSLQAELRERTEQYNQLWLTYQQQFADIERLHMHTVQQLQLELADARERSGAYNDESRRSQTNSNDASQYGQKNGSQQDLNGSVASSAITGILSNGTSDNVQSFASSGNASSQSDHVAGVPVALPSLLGMPTYLPPGQVTALHPFVMHHQQGVPHSVPSHVPQSHVGHFQSVPAKSSIQQWEVQQAVSEGTQISSQNDLQPSQNDQNHIKPDVKHNYEMSGNRQSLHPDYLKSHVSQRTEPDSVIPSSATETQVESIDRGFLVNVQPEQSLQQISSQFHDSLRMGPAQQNIETKEQNAVTLIDHGMNNQVINGGQPSSTINASLSDAPSLPSVLGETKGNNAASAVLHEAHVSIGQTNSVAVGNSAEAALLDERSLLACIVRTIPAGGQTRISSTLPNRLGKMLAPLHWHDYKKKYGKLDDFVAGHPNLFAIEGDYIQLREGAQEMISAAAAAAKVAAAAAASSPHSSYHSSVAVTPMAQANRLKKVQQPNGAMFGATGGLSNVELSSKSNNDYREPNGPRNRPLPLSGNGAFQSMASTNGRPTSNLAVGKQQGRRQHGRN